MLTSVIGDFLPLAIAVALSPVPIIAVILMLGTPRARTNGPAFAVGWIVGLAAVSTLVLLLAGGADDPDSAALDRRRLVALVWASCSWSWRPSSGRSGRRRARRRRCRSGWPPSTTSHRASPSDSGWPCRPPIRRTWP